MNEKENQLQERIRNLESRVKALEQNLSLVKIHIETENF